MRYSGELLVRCAGQRSACAVTSAGPSHFARFCATLILRLPHGSETLGEQHVEVASPQVAVESTFNLPLMKPTIDTVVSVDPTSTKAT